MPEEIFVGRKDKHGEITQKPTHCIVSKQRLPASGFITENIGDGWFVRYAGVAARHITEEMRAGWQKIKPVASIKKVVKDSK